jgi:hypothetical protein
MMNRSDLSEPTITIIYGLVNKKGGTVAWKDAPKLPPGWLYEAEADGDDCDCGGKDTSCTVCRESGLGVYHCCVYG